MKKFEFSYWDAHQIKKMILVSTDIVEAIKIFSSFPNMGITSIKLIIEIS